VQLNELQHFRSCELMMRDTRGCVSVVDCSSA
jgi:hypothetical protein